MFLKSFVARALARALAFLVLFGFSLAIPSSENGTIRQPEKKKHARYDTPAPTFRHSFDFKGEKTFAFYTSGHVDLDPVRRFCVEKGGKIAITRTSEEQRAVMKHIYEADASRPWEDRKYLLGGFRGRLPRPPGGVRLLGPWKWVQENEENYNEVTTVIQKLDEFLWASPLSKNPEDDLSTEYILTISSGSGFGAIRKSYDIEDLACEFEPGGVTLPTAKSHSAFKVKSTSCAFKEKTFTFHTNLLKREEAPDFFTTANRFCNESGGGSLAMFKTEDVQNAVHAFMRAKFGEATFLLGGEYNATWSWVDGTKIPPRTVKFFEDIDKLGKALVLKYDHLNVKDKTAEGDFICENARVKSGGVPCISRDSTVHSTHPTTGNPVSESRKPTQANPPPRDPAQPGPNTKPQSRTSGNESVSENRDLVGLLGAVLVTITISFL